MSATQRERADAVLMPTYRRYPVTFARGKGFYLYDETGRPYLDFVAGVAVTALGHAHPAVTEAVARQAGRLVHTSNHYYTEPMAQLAGHLTRLLGWPDGRVFFANSGAEANECALKLVRKAVPGRPETIAAWGSFHGRTMQTLAATGQPAKWEAFQPLPPGFVHVPYDDAPAVEAAVSDATAAVLLEPVQGEGGVVVPGMGYLPAVRSICDDHGVALLLDEVQTGLGRTGEWFGFQAYGDHAVPDVISLAKALGNGFPIGACIARGRYATAFAPGDHATTVGGGPVVCAAALAVLETIERDGLVERARKVGDYLRQGLAGLVESHELPIAVRGKGLLLALQLGSDSARDVAMAALSEGLLVNDVCPSVLRFCPPLTIGEAECDEAVDILAKVLRRLAA
ncbi:MAG: acetylornithine/N-succinyldiaminopimelate aminotransferase [Actinomycetota bacterium]|nr:acetylornithine/N-succinyldiaminopimelate aminotransferase [Actinomycetota bacterium]